MGIFDDIKTVAFSTIKSSIEREVFKAGSNIKKEAGDALKDQINFLTGASKKEVFVFNSSVDSVEELKLLPEFTLDTPYKTAALVMLALLRFESSPEDFYEMFDELNGPNEVTEYDHQFLSERFKNAPYIARSFFKGASVENNYTPDQPLTISIYKYAGVTDEENWQRLWVESAGADEPRLLILRKKPSVGKWYINSIQCLGSIRLPKDLDDWS